MNVELKELGALVAYFIAAAGAMAGFGRGLIGLLRLRAGIRYSERLREQKVANPEQKAALLLKATEPNGFWRFAHADDSKRPSNE